MDGRSRRRPMHETTGRNPRTIRGDADWLPAGRAVRLERQAVSSRIRVLCSTSCSAPCPPPPPRVARREHTIARGTGRGPAAASADGHQPRRPAESAGTPAGHADLRRVPARRGRHSVVRHPRTARTGTGSCSVGAAGPSTSRRPPRSSSCAATSRPRSWHGATRAVPVGRRASGGPIAVPVPAGGSRRIPDS
jgi:hypothetical protein